MNNTTREAANIFRKCIRNHAKSRAVCGYLIRKKLGDVPGMDAMLDEWFAKRTQDAAWTPNIDEYDERLNGQVATSDSDSRESCQADEEILLPDVHT